VDAFDVHQAVDEDVDGEVRNAEGKKKPDLAGRAFVSK
jgi:hypothetical protein